MLIKVDKSDEKLCNNPVKALIKQQFEWVFGREF